MTTQDQTQAQDQAPDENPAGAPQEGSEGSPGAKVPEKPENAAEGDTGPEEGTLPEWARERLTKANNEAARYRTQLRDVQAQLEKAKSPEEFETARAELNTQIEALTHQLLVEKVARQEGLPDALVSRLQGSTEEELTADAKSLAELLGATKPHAGARGGLTPNAPGDGLPDDPREIAKLMKANRGHF